AASHPASRDRRRRAALTDVEESSRGGRTRSTPADAETIPHRTTISLVSRLCRCIYTGDKTLGGAAAHAMLVKPAGGLAGAIKTGDHLAVHIDHLAMRIDS